jgi:hypothetical protein
MIQEEMMTARVMDMMDKLDDVEEENENENENEFDRVIFNQVNSNKRMIVNDDDDDDDDLIRNTNFENIAKTETNR